MSRIVAIVGRPNVGKSTLFNRLTGSRKAIVDDIAGVTRDRHGAMVEWNGQTFTVVDTGGFVEGTEDVMERAINLQVKAAMEQADLLLMMVDVQTGITDLDAELADQLRRSRKP
ncbi:MAG: GTPase, partial [Bacteroidota bacterium]